jgi:hypothetical protein
LIETEEFRKWVDGIDKWLSEAKYKDVIDLQVEPNRTPRAFFSPCKKYVFFPMQDIAIDLTNPSKRLVSSLLEDAKERVVELRESRKKSLSRNSGDSIDLEMYYARRLSDAIIEECFLEKILCDITEKEMLS